MNQEYDEHEVERYIERLKQLNSSQRVELYYQLIKGGGSIASEVLLKALYITLPNNPIGYEVTHQLRRLGDKSVIGPLIEILRKDSDAQARSNAARALGKLNEQSAVGPLIQALEDPDEKIRTDSAVALGHLGDKAAVAVEPLLRLLKKTSVEDLSAVVGSLAKLGVVRFLN